MGLVEGLERFLEALAPAAVEVNDGADARRVQLGEVVLHALGRQVLLAAAEVVVDVDDREHRLLDGGHFRDQHRARLPVAQLEFTDVARRLGRGQGTRPGDGGNGQQHVCLGLHGKSSEARAPGTSVPAAVAVNNQKCPTRAFS